MVYNPEQTQEKEQLTAFLTVKLTHEQLDAIQYAFGKGSFSQSPSMFTVLFIIDRPEYHGRSHADIRRAETNEKPFLVIDEKTPIDGGIWYVDNFASEEEVEDGEAESTNVVWKIRIKIEDVPVLHANYDIANRSIREDLDSVGVDYPCPEEFEQDEVYTSGLDTDEDRFLAPTWVTVEPGEYDETTDEEILKTCSPRFEKVYRLKPNIAKDLGFISRWIPAGTARPLTLSDGTTKTFAEGSVVLQMDYDPKAAWAGYQRPEGSL
ncbi:hypothetical protein K491DRAFT_690780 [Lophiostoma macrostomum CBS 122681]|uniref:Uncharacterized protein n=1 Tax=Lophiostoma macrostomum CBS 122681 TaxID=1314788 RepID=A0A6A6TCH7_9PLEO|nr:hypothetical protein K491DRAFT_690780 [Lophiostoma macrostomum CBS 122681]